jgi:hypothetical protein
MPGFYKAAAIVMSGGVLVGLGALMMVPRPQEDTRPSSTLVGASQIANFFPKPCKQQLWLNTLNTDGVCQTWNLSDRDAERLLAVPEPPAKASRQPSKPAADSHVSKSEMVVKTRARLSHTADSQPRPAREAGSHSSPREAGSHSSPREAGSRSRMPTRASTPAASPTVESRRAGFPG